MVSFPQVSQTEPCAHPSPPPYAPHAPPISFFSMAKLILEILNIYTMRPARHWRFKGLRLDKFSLYCRNFGWCDRLSQGLWHHKTMQRTQTIRTYSHVPTVVRKMLVQKTDLMTWRHKNRPWRMSPPLILLPGDSFCLLFDDLASGLKHSRTTTDFPKIYVTSNRVCDMEQAL